MSTQVFAESYICKQVGYVNVKTGKYIAKGDDIFLTVVPEDRKTVTITRIDGKEKSKIEMSFFLKEVRKNTTAIAGDGMIIMTSHSLEEPVRARLIGPHKEDHDSISSVIDLGTESFIKKHKSYEERYYCLREEEKREQI